MCLTEAAADVIAHGIGEALQALGTVLADPGDGRGHEMHTEEVCHRLGQTLLGQQLVVQQIQHHGVDPLAALASARRRPRETPLVVCVPHAGQRQPCARCSVTTSGCGSGRSNTCRATWSVAIAAVNAVLHAVQAGRRIMLDDDIGRLSPA